MTPKALFAGCILAVSMAGCSARSDCAVLFDAVEPSLTEVRAALPPPSGQDDAPLPTAAALRATSAAYSNLAASLESADIRDAELKKRADSYRANAAELAAGFEMLAVALETEDEAKLKTAREKIHLAATNEQIVWHNIDIACGNH